MRLADVGPGDVALGPSVSTLPGGEAQRVKKHRGRGHPRDPSPLPGSRRAGLLASGGAGTDTATGRPNVTAGFSVRRGDGNLLASLPETSLRPAPDGNFARSLRVPIEGALPGRYEAIVVVTDLAAGRLGQAGRGAPSARFPTGGRRSPPAAAREFREPRRPSLAWYDSLSTGPSGPGDLSSRQEYAA